jgi:DNA-binding NtrC family response regulator
MKRSPVAKILVIDNDPMVCGIITNCLLDGGSEAEWVACTRLGAQMLVRDRFDLALINGAFAEVSGAALAEIAANENTAVLLLCGDADTGNNVRRFGFPYLERPISLERLSSDATELIARSRENIGRVKTAAARMRANTEALEAASPESRRLLGETNR